MALTFDHAICAVGALDEGIRVFADLGFTVDPGGTHSTGTHNAVIPLRRGYLEVLSVYDDALARRTQRHGAISEYLASHPGGIIGYVLRTEDIDADAARIASSGLTFEGPQAAQRVQPTGEVLRWRVLRPAPQPAPAVLPMIAWGDQSASGVAEHENTIHAASAISIAARSLEELVRISQAFLGAPAGEPIDRPDLDARQATITVDSFEIRLLAPVGPGAVQRHLDRHGEGPMELELLASDLGRAAAAIGLSRAPDAGGFAIPPDRALGMALRVVPDSPTA